MVQGASAYLLGTGLISAAEAKAWADTVWATEADYEDAVQEDAEQH